MYSEHETFVMQGAEVCKEKEEPVNFGRSSS